VEHGGLQIFVLCDEYICSRCFEVELGGTFELAYVNGKISPNDQLILICKLYRLDSYARWEKWSEAKWFAMLHMKIQPSCIRRTLA